MVISQFGALIALAKLSGAADVGRLGLALAICTPAFMFANLGLRVGRSTDMKLEFTLSDYLGLRIITTTLATLLLLAMCFIAAFEDQTMWVIAAVTLLRGVETLNDIAYGAFQHRERMRAVGISMLIRGLGGFSIFLATYATTSHLPAALVAQSLFWVLVFAAHDFPVLKSMIDSSESTVPKFETARLKALARVGLPLGLTALLTIGQMSAPRIAVEYFFGLKELGYVTAMFTFMAGTMLVGGAVAQAVTPRLARLWHENERQKFWRLMAKLMIVSISAVGACMAALAIHGDLVLEVAFTPDFADYKPLLLIIAAAAIVRLTAGMLQINILARRLFNRFLIVHLLLFAAAVVTSIVFVRAFGSNGAGWSLLAVAILHLACIAGITATSFNRSGATPAQPTVDLSDPT